MLEPTQDLEQHVAKLLERTDRIRDAVIHVKDKTAELRTQASQVGASASVTSGRADARSDFAFGLLGIVEVAVFDFAVRDELEAIMAEMSRVWVVDGANEMSSRVQQKYNEVQAKVAQLQPGNEWS